MVRAPYVTLAVAMTLLAAPAGADDLTAIIQVDLQTLGYDPGGTDGEMTVQTAVAISKFQAENSLAVTGEASPQLAGVIKAALKNGGQAPPQAQPAATNAAAPSVGPAQQAPAADSASAFSAIAGAVAPSIAQSVVAGATGVDPAMLQMVTGGQAQQADAMDPAAQAMQLQAARMMGGLTGMDPAAIQAMQMEALALQAQDENAAGRAEIQAQMAAAGVDPATLQALMSGGAPTNPVMIQAGTMSPEQLQAMLQAGQMPGAAGMDPAAAQMMMQAGMDPAAMQAMMAAMQAQGEAAQPQSDPAAQQACLQEKIAAAQEAQQAAQRRRGLGSLMRGISRLGGAEVAASVASASAEIANANAVINDLESAARDLGLTEEEVASCRTKQ